MKNEDFEEMRPYNDSEVSQVIEKLIQQGHNPALFDMRFLKPLDTKLLHHVFQNFSKIITVEDGCITGGLGSAAIEFMCDHGYNAKIKRLGIPDRFIEHGTQTELYHECGFDKQGIYDSALKLLE